MSLEVHGKVQTQQLSYGVVVNWGLSKKSDLKRSDLMWSVMLFPAWRKAMRALRCQTLWCIYGVSLGMCAELVKSVHLFGSCTFKSACIYLSLLLNSS